MIRPRLHALGPLGFTALLISTPTLASSGSQELSFNHLTDVPREYTRQLRGGDTLEITIEDTCPDLFAYEHFGVLPEDAEANRAGAKVQKASDIDIARIKAIFGITCVIEKGSKKNQKALEITHKRKFGGYVVEIRKKASAIAMKFEASELQSLISDIGTHCAPFVPNNCKAALSSRGSASVKTLLADQKQRKKELDSVTFTVDVPRAGWSQELAGGFTISQLADEKYALVTQGEGGDQTQVVVREKDLEDDQELGLAGLIHLNHAKLPSFAISLGIGINKTSEASYFFGPSWRLGGKGFITVGVNYGPVDTRPSGVRVSPDPRDPGVEVDDLFPVSDPNVLNNLGSRNKGALFASFSYTFLSPGEAFFTKKFASSDDTKKDDKKDKK